MVAPALLALLASLSAGPVAPPAVAPDSVARDSVAAAPPRIARRLDEFLVRASRLHDPRSSETVHLIGPRELRALPLDGFTQAVALKAGVIAQDGALHVRGGRAGELSVVLDGIALSEPLRGRPLELPLLAVRSASLVSGAPDAEFGGALAGVLNVSTVDPAERWSGEARWNTDAPERGSYDRAAARVSGPLGFLGLGVAASADVTLDDTHLPALRSAGRRSVLGREVGWRADDHLLGFVKIAPVASPSLSLQLLSSRRIDRPYSPMWSLDGWTIPCGDPLCVLGPKFSPSPLPGYTRYRAADHAVMTEERRQAGILAWSRPRTSDRMSAALGLARDRSITSLGAHDDESYLVPARVPLFGNYESPTSDPYLVYAGDEPYFRKSASDAWSLRADYERWTRRGNRAKAGFGTTYESVQLRELDVTTFKLGLDSLRAYRAFAPGGFAYAQGRWVFEGLVLSAGLRGEYFTAGPQGMLPGSIVRPKAVWSLSPRLGITYPISPGDVFSLAYSRIQQDPPRDFLYDQRTAPNSNHPVGNPSLAPATVISYQAALKHLFAGGWALQGALFYRDLYGQIGARNVLPPNRPSFFQYSDADDGHASGVELTLLRENRPSVNLEAHYTWMIARGSESFEEGLPFHFLNGLRPVPIGDHPLTWDRRHTFTLATWWDAAPRLSVGWTTLIGSGLPWTPAQRRRLVADLSDVNTRRFKWEESSALSARWFASDARHLNVGLEVRNVFDYRSDARATLSGFPHVEINTAYDDYGAFRTETGLPGGAVWDDRNGDGVPGWVRVHDPRLENPPRMVRLSVGTSW